MSAQFWAKLNEMQEQIREQAKQISVLAKNLDDLMTTAYRQNIQSRTITREDVKK